MSDAIQTADLEWQSVDGIDVPISKQFGDVYFSKDNGLLESRHVFLNGNDLATRLAELTDFDYFCVAETGFGSALNSLALWQMWQQQRPDNHSHLHLISIEKFPLSKIDLIRALQAWPELQVLATQLIEQYPLPIAGCHRLNFPNARFSIDLWLGDANEVLPQIVKTKAVDAWFLDGFAPSTNPEMWQTHILDQIVRLSDYGTTFASFSVAGVLKRGLTQHGISISRPRGFKHKREMLKAIWLAPDMPQHSADALKNSNTQAVQHSSLQHTAKQRQIAIIGAGIAGLTCAHAFASRGHQVTLYDQTAPLAGASGNPLALLNPRLGAIEHSSKHWVTLAWQYALPHYQRFKAFQAIEVNQLLLKPQDNLHELAAHYPTGVFAQQPAHSTELNTSYPSVKFLPAGTVSPSQLCAEILQQPNIHFQRAQVIQLKPVKHQQKIQVIDHQQQCLAEFDHVIVCAAMQSKLFSAQLPKLQPNRGQVSWFKHAEQPLAINQAYSYGGYCMPLDADHLLVGASFHPDCEDDSVLAADHQHNYDQLNHVFPDYAQSLAPIETWQGRASVRTQSPDYFPLLGKIHTDAEIYTLTALGSKGFLFAPLCSEVLVAQILQQACPLSAYWLDKLSPQRFIKKVKPKKPYYQKPDANT